MAKNILPLIRPLDEIKADLEIRTEEAETDLEILYDDAKAYEILVQSIMANKRLSAEISHRWAIKHDYLFCKRTEYFKHFYVFPKEPPNHASESSKA